jgi:hypothetical protein
LGISVCTARVKTSLIFPTSYRVIDFRGAWKKMFADAAVDRRKLHDMRRSAIRNAIRRGVDRNTAKMSGRLTTAFFPDTIFRRWTTFGTRRIEQGAARASATKSATDAEAPTEQGQIVQ